MMKLAAIICALQSVSQPASTAEPLALARPVAAGALLSPLDFNGDARSTADFVGKEVRRFMPAGAIVRATDVREPLLVLRNTVVRMQFVKGLLSITADGRAMSSGAHGESVRVMSLQSRTTIVGVVAGEGLVQVQ